MIDNVKEIDRQPSSSVKWYKGKTMVLTTLVGWVPLPPGQILRNILYRSIVKQIGFPVWIKPQVEFTDGSSIAIANRVSIGRGVCIDAPQTNEVHLGERVNLHPEVRIRCRGTKSQVFLAEKVCLDRGVDVKAHDGGRIEIGESSYIGPYTCLSGYGNIKIGKNCLIASHSSIYAHNHIFTDPNKNIKDQGFSVKGIVIEDDCWLGTGAKILDGVTVGKGSVIGAGAVVCADIPPNSIAVGVPAKIISHRN